MKMMDLVIPCFLFSLPVHAEPEIGPGEIVAHPERAKEIRGRLLKEKLGLDEDGASQIENILDRYQKLFRALKNKMRMTKRALKTTIHKGGVSNDEIRAAVTSLRAVRKEMFDLRERQLDEVLPLLNPIQQAKFVIVLDKIKKRFRDKARHHQREGRKLKRMNNAVPDL